MADLLNSLKIFAVAVSQSQCCSVIHQTEEKNI